MPRGKKEIHLLRKGHYTDSGRPVMFCGAAGNYYQTDIEFDEDIRVTTCTRCRRKFWRRRREESLAKDPLSEAFRGCGSAEALDGELREVFFVGIKADRRRLREPEVAGLSIDPYVGMSADYSGVEDSVLAEALERETFTSNVDCDEWEQELKFRKRDPDWSSLWVVDANIGHGFWDP